jgi:hypothetical protein
VYVLEVLPLTGGKGKRRLPVIISRLNGGKGSGFAMQQQAGKGQGPQQGKPGKVWVWHGAKLRRWEGV